MGGIDPLQPMEHNPKGFHEDAYLNRLLDELHKGHGDTWLEPGGGVDAAALDGYVQARRRRDGGLWGVKAPRLVQSLPVFVDALVRDGQDVLVVGVWRPVWEIAMSLSRLHGGNLVKAQGMAQMLVRLRDKSLSWAMREGLPVHAVNYHDLLLDPVGEVARVAGFVGVEPTGEAVEWVDPGMRHEGRL